MFTLEVYTRQLMRGDLKMTVPQLRFRKEFRSVKYEGTYDFSKHPKESGDFVRFLRSKMMRRTILFDTGSFEDQSGFFFN
jgi:hypothetical protein